MVHSEAKICAPSFIFDRQAVSTAFLLPHNLHFVMTVHAVRAVTTAPGTSRAVLNLDVVLYELTGCHGEQNRKVP